MSTEGNAVSKRQQLEAKYNKYIEDINKLKQQIKEEEEKEREAERREREKRYMEIGGVFDDWAGREISADEVKQILQGFTPVVVSAALAGTANGSEGAGQYYQE